MIQTSHSATTPSLLARRLQANETLEIFRRRAVLIKCDSKWMVVACTVEPLMSAEVTAREPLVRRYKFARLIEEFLTGQECVDFATSIDVGKFEFAGDEVERDASGGWTTQQFPVNNAFMRRTGHVVSIEVGRNQNADSYQHSLVAIAEPYYPNIFEAVADWISLQNFMPDSGRSDSRIGKVHFLLPEERAYIAGACFCGSNELQINVAGTEVGRLDLAIKGAYWKDGGIKHFGSSVNGRTLSFDVPASVRRVEYCLIDANSAIYDAYDESAFSHTRLERRGAEGGEDALTNQVRVAANTGEGTRIEFKPLVRLEKRKSNDVKQKWDEIIESVVGFSNAEGGSIYLGIDNHCCVTGVDNDLYAWDGDFKADDRTPVDRYIGALRSSIKDEFQVEVNFGIGYTKVDGKTVIVVDVPAAPNRPIGRRDGRYLYLRKGASNQSLVVEQITAYYENLAKQTGE